MKQLIWIATAVVLAGGACYGEIDHALMQKHQKQFHKQFDLVGAIPEIRPEPSRKYIVNDLQAHLY